MPSIILFPHEARAAAAGTLRQLWRPMKVQPPESKTGRWSVCAGYTERRDVDKWSFKEIDPKGCSFTERGRESYLLTIKPPFQPGDALACREVWFYEEHMHDITAGEPDLPGGRWSHRVIYRATNPEWTVDVGVGAHGWKSPATMPAWAVRSRVKVECVAVKRVQEMTEEDAKAWGCSHSLVPGWQYQGKQTARETAAIKWNSRFARRGLGWDKNPWCFVENVEWAGRPS
jgi:hypothetical protein